MQAALSYILDYCIETSNISVVNSDAGSIYFIPYDGLFFDEILSVVPYVEFDQNFEEDIDELNFTIACKYSHVGPNNNLYARYELSLGNTVLCSETAKITEKQKTHPFSLLRAAKKCSRKIIFQERLALKRSMVKNVRTGLDYQS